MHINKRNPLITQIVGSGMFGLSLWLRVEPGFQEWVDFLHIGEFYIGIDILIVAAVLVIIISFFGCASALMENQLALLVVSILLYTISRVYTCSNINYRLICAWV